MSEGRVLHAGRACRLAVCVHRGHGLILDTRHQVTVVAVIKGDDVTIESHGDTFINGKTGVTSATVEAVPDVPFESIEVTVPQGPFSEFGANLPHGRLNFCGHELVMPILLKAQNGKKRAACEKAGRARQFSRASVVLLG